MPVTQRGFSLAEVAVAMAIGSVLLVSAGRFIPALQRATLRQTQRSALQETLWQRLTAIAKQAQRAGYCNGACTGEPLTIAAACLLVRWDSNSNGVWEQAEDVTGFRLREGVLETQRGASDCNGGGWDKMTDPATFEVTHFQVERHGESGFAPTITLSLSARQPATVALFSASTAVTGYNL